MRRGEILLISGHSLFVGNKIKNYEEILTGAHRNPSPRARPPFLVCHLGFWEPLKVESVETAKDARDERKKQIDAYLTSLWRTLNSRGALLKHLMPNLINDDVLLLTSYIDKEGVSHAFKSEGSRHRPIGVQSVTLAFKWHDARATIRLEKRTEYVTLTLILDLSPFLSKDEQNALLKTDSSCLRSVFERLVELEKLVSSQERQSSKYKKIYEGLYNEVWDQFYDDILSHSTTQQALLGDIFADFRGLVLATPRVWDQSDEVPQAPQFQPPFWRKTPGWWRREDGTDAADTSAKSSIDPNNPSAADLGRSSLPRKAEEWQEILQKFWPLLTVRSSGVDFHNYEFTASRMLKGRALYVSALGAQPPDLKADVRVPLYYFIYSDTLNGWQIGRLGREPNKIIVG